MKKRMSIKTVIRQFRQRAPYWTGKLPELPDMLYQVIEASQHLSQHQAQQQAELRKLHYEIRNSARRTVWATLGCTLILTSAVLLGFSEFTGQTIADVPLITAILAVLGVGCLLSARGK